MWPIKPEHCWTLSIPDQVMMLPLICLLWFQFHFLQYQLLMFGENSEVYLKSSLPSQRKCPQSQSGLIVLWKAVPLFVESLMAIINLKCWAMLSQSISKGLMQTCQPWRRTICSLTEREWCKRYKNIFFIYNKKIIFSVCYFYKPLV